MQNRWLRQWSPVTRILAFVALTWVPLAILAGLGGTELVRGFVQARATHFRLLLAGPLAIAAEPSVERALARATRYFVETGIVPTEQREHFAAVEQSIERLGQARLAGVLALAVAYLLAFWQVEYAQLPRMVASVASEPVGWAWYLWVSRPLLQFLLLRWLWRLLLWTILLARTSRLRLCLSAAHPDHTGGLGFLAQTQSRFASVAFSFAVVWATGFGERVRYAWATVESLELLLPIFILLMAVIFLGPLVVFTPKLFRLREHALLDYGELGNRYSGMFERRWIGPGSGSSELLLGTQDIQAFADLQATVGAVRTMRIVPIDQTALIAIMAGTLLPLLPLLDLVLPLRELVRRAILPMF